YDRWEVENVWIRDVRDAAPGPDGEKAIELTLDTTPFYAESGGQVADTGTLEMPGMKLRITDVYKDGDRIVHRAELGEGQHALAHVGSGPYRAIVNAEARLPTQRNHTATHLLHAALRARFGKELKQAGSLVAPDRLRFDFTHAKALTPEDIHAVETAVNEEILKDVAVQTEVTSLKAAQETGAMALFGEKYGDRVRQVIVPGYSRELCGGCHVRRTGEIGYFRIESEAAVASGTRRIEVVTGALAFRHAEEDRRLLRELAGRLGAGRDQLVERLSALQEETKALKAAQAKQSARGLRDQVERLIEDALKMDPPLVVAEVSASGVEEMREAGDLIRRKLPNGGGLLAAAVEGKLSVVASVGSALQASFSAADWARDAVSIADGKGGGKPEQAVAGAKDASRLRDVLDRGRAYARERLK
ncbi:MAG TPA: DHHA1 domain-containing protein, partial [Candidatus Angelobacter sp.]|nr:DHHA1 domain-containing protein [Candidatus Angelobacter sp.]